jgi:catechol-2,3-dioxygenase
MRDFYLTFLGAQIAYENPSLVFLAYDSEHHRIAIVNMPDLKPRDPKASGLFHVAFTFSSLNDLALAYLQRKENGIRPFWCVNHGPTTSMYYHDPDGNDIETQVDNFESADEANAFMRSEFFEMNPIGTDFDPEELVKRLEAGEDEAVIKKRVEIGKRGVPAF